MNISPELKRTIENEIDQTMEEHSSFLGYMKDRWEDEKDYEDWNDYKKLIAEKFKDKKNKKILKVGITYEYENALITIKANKRDFKVSYKLIK